jgi:hypothetical protein
MNLVKKIALVFVATAFLAGSLGGCKKEETAGEKVDKAVDSVKKEAEKAAPK